MLVVVVESPLYYHTTGEFKKMRSQLKKIASLNLVTESLDPAFGEQGLTP